MTKAGTTNKCCGTDVEDVYLSRQWCYRTVRDLQQRLDLLLSFIHIRTGRNQQLKLTRETAGGSKTAPLYHHHKQYQPLQDL